MALINCPECDKEISDKATNCPNCGVTICAMPTSVIAGPIKPKSKKRILIPIVIAAFVVLGGIGTFVGMQIHKSNTEAAIAQAIIIKDQQAYDTANEAYLNLCSAADLTISVMDSVYGAWRFGIYDADDSTSSTVLTNLAKETSLSKSELEAGVKSLAESFDVSESNLLSALVSESKDISNWQFCLYVVHEAYNANGVFDEIRTNIDAANNALKTMTANYDDYKHYPALKEFYSKISSYFEFAENPSGSFQQLANTINDYENSIRTYRSDLSFIFK